MNILITGGAGFIGSNLARELSSEGHSVTILDNLVSGYLRNLDALDVRFVNGDVRRLSTLPGIMDKVDIVYHMAASVGNKRSIDDPICDSDVNVLGTLNVLEAARMSKVPKVVFSSSAGIFGELKTLPISEDHPCEPDSPYGASKLCAEKQCLVYSKLYDLDCVCLRYFNVYGPNQRFDSYGNVIPIFVFRILRSQSVTIFGDGEQTRDFVNVRDVVQANRKSGMKPRVSGAFNVGSATRVTINHLIDLIFEASDIRPSLQYAPPRAGDVRDSLV